MKIIRGGRERERERERDRERELAKKYIIEFDSYSKSNILAM